MKTKSVFFSVLLVCCFLIGVSNQKLIFSSDTLLKYKRRKITYVSASGISSVSGLVALNELWYKAYPRNSFHFFNDNSEWFQMDKFGHCYSSYQLGRISYSAMKWAGFNDNKALYLGGISGSIYLSMIELMDGFSDGWGFSTGDLLANFSGSALFIVQQKIWNEQKVLCKFSFHRTNYPSYRPEILGSNVSQEFFKDYNGQSYWLSFNLKSLFFPDTKFPSYMNFALGFGADGMLSANRDYIILKSDGTIIGQNSRRNFFISLDIDLTRIKTKSKFLKYLFSVLNSVKVPFPALELSKSGVQSHLLYH